MGGEDTRPPHREKVANASWASNVVQGYIEHMPIGGKAIKGRGAALQVPNRFLKSSYGIVHWEGIDEVEDGDVRTRYLVEHAKSLVNPVDSPDLPFNWSMNPYQGCEHGCAYCYVRPTHEYWGYSAGLDFERVILMKRSAPDLLRKTLMDPKWDAEPITISGNTDPYQPIERKEGITRKLLEILLEFKHPAGMITKNAMILRDLDLLTELAAMRLVSVAISFTTLNEDLRRVMEPRTSTGANRLRTMEALSKAGVPVMVMIAPVIPALNEEKIPDLLQAAADAGAYTAGYTVLRTNGAVKPIFKSWLKEHFPDRATKVLAQLGEMHRGATNDSQFGRRMSGVREYAHTIRQLFDVVKGRCFGDRPAPVIDRTLFQRPEVGQLDLFR